MLLANDPFACDLKHAAAEGSVERAPEKNMMAKQSFIAVVAAPTWTLPHSITCFRGQGKQSSARKFDLGFGGKGANQAFAARLCGANVGMVAKVGGAIVWPSHDFF